MNDDTIHRRDWIKPAPGPGKAGPEKPDRPADAPGKADYAAWRPEGEGASGDAASSTPPLSEETIWQRARAQQEAIREALAEQGLRSADAPVDNGQAPQASSSSQPAPHEEPAPNAAEITAAGSALGEEEIARLSRDIIAALKSIYDPEIPADIYELGLIYKIDIEDDRSVTIDMTLTAPACPVAGEMPVWVENAVSAVPGVSAVRVNLVFVPPWDPSRMSEEARVALNMF